MVRPKEQVTVARTGLRQASGEGNPGAEAPGAASPERVRALEAERQSLVALLNILRAGEPASRQDLEREARLGRAVVTDRLATLSAFGLVDEGGVGRSIGGRAPRLVRFRAEAARILVANINAETIGVGLADLGGRLILEHYEDFSLAMPPELVLERLESLFEWSLGNDGAPLWAISLGVPSATERAEGARLAFPRLGALPAWDEARLAQRLARRFGVPIWVHSAVQMETMGEVAALPERLRRDMIYVDLGAEISTGIVMDGRLNRGTQGLAGQLGHVFAGHAASSKVCGCGNVGCLRTVAGCEAIAQSGLEAARAGQSRYLAETLAQTGAVTVADIGMAARFGDAFCADLLAQSGRLVGTVLATLVNVLNPAFIVLGGELAQTGDICLAAIREGIYRHAQPLVSRDISIVRSRLGRSAGLSGAASLVLGELFAPDFLEDWLVEGTPLAHPEVAALLAEADVSSARA